MFRWLNTTESGIGLEVNSSLTLKSPLPSFVLMTGEGTVDRAL